MAGRKPSDKCIEAGKATRFTSKTASAAGKKGGTKSGESKRAKKALAEALRIAMHEDAPDAVKFNFKKAGYDIEDNQDAVVAAVLMGAIKGNPRMVKMVTDILGESSADKVKQEQLEMEKQRMEIYIEKQRAEIERLRKMTDDDDGWTSF